MTQIYEQANACKIEKQPHPESIREFVTVAVRSARVRVQLLQCELDEIGVALKHKMVTPEIAVGWLHDLDALRFVNPDVWRETPAVSA